MKRIYKVTGLVLIGCLISIESLFAGNPDRSGQAGGGQLLINPWAKSSGLANANTASVSGIESMFLNIAGTTNTNKTEMAFAHTWFLSTTDISINSVGITQAIGKNKTSVLGLGIMTMSYGDIMVTTVENPEGGLGTFSPNLTNIGISYAKKFSQVIRGGINFRVISESISNIRGQGMAVDAGIQYITGDKENIKLGVSIRNVGTRIKYNGDGLDYFGKGQYQSYNMTLSQRSQDFELPSLLNIGGTYDFHIDKAKDAHIISVSANFTSNSFTRDQYIVGLEYAWKKMFFLRGGYAYEKGITKAAERTTVYTGPCAGTTLSMPFGKDKKSSIDLDYSYRATNPFNGIHTVGARINL